MKNGLVLLPLITLLILGCDPKEDFPKANTSGGSTGSTFPPTNAFSLAAESWTFGVSNVGSAGNPNNYQSMRITSGANSISPISATGLTGLPSRTSSYSLSIAATTINDTSSLSYWSCRVAPSATLRFDKSLTLKAKVHLENVQGRGASLVLRGDKGTKKAVLFATTEGQTNIRGTAGFRDYSVTLPYSSPVDYMLVYLTMLSQTTGKVTFSDVSIQIN